jgi:UDP-glucose 4-epimerase
MRSVLVTGGFGFLGSHLVERLLAEGARVHVVDDLSSSAVEPKVFYEGLSQFDRERLTWHVGSFRDACVLDQHFAAIYHLASPVGPVGVLGHAGKIAPSIVGGAEVVCALAKRDQARLVFVSTSEIYGGGRHGLCLEEDPKTIAAVASARLEYAVGKLAAEVMIENLARVDALHAVIIRPFNIAGPRQSARGGFVLPRFVQQAIAGANLTVYGDGKAVRAFTHVRDVAAGLVLACENGKPGDVYNLGNAENKTSIYGLAKRVIELTASESRIEHVDPKKLHGEEFAEASDKYPDASKAERALGWKPEHDLDRTVNDVVEFYRRHTAL